MPSMSQQPKQIVGVLLAAVCGQALRRRQAGPSAGGRRWPSRRMRLATCSPVLPDVGRRGALGDFPLYDMREQEGCRVTMFQGGGTRYGGESCPRIAEARGADGLGDRACRHAPVRQPPLRKSRGALGEGALIAAPNTERNAAIQVGFGAKLRDELLALDGAHRRARAVLERHARARRIDCDDSGVLYDVDRKTESRANEPQLPPSAAIPRGVWMLAS